MKIHLLNFVISASCILFLHPISSAQIMFEFQQGMNDYTGTSDTYFQTGNPQQVHGEDQEWEWDGLDADGSNYGALHFSDIIGSASYQIPLNSKVIRAYLTFTVTNTGTASDIANVHNLLKPFTEEMSLTDFTVNIEPKPDEDYSPETVADIPCPSVGDIIEVDVTSSLQKWVDGSSNYGWMIVPAPSSTNGVGIQSSEVLGSIVPRLTITTLDNTYVFRDGINGYSGTIDTWLNTGFGAANVYGGRNWFEWDGEDNGGANYGLLRFEGIFGNGTNQIPLGTTIANAVIEMTIQNDGDDGVVHGLLAGSVLEPTDFDETNTTMTDFGDGFEPRAGTDYEENSIGIIDGELGTQLFDVTLSFQRYSSGIPNRGWIIIPTGGDSGGVEVISSERAIPNVDGKPPRLTVIIEDKSTTVREFILY